MNFFTQSLFICLIVSVVASVGSLFFSEVMEFTPCSLCWFQRILMYPMVILFSIAFLKDDKKIFAYTNTLSVLGMLLALYHNLIVWELIPEAASPCREGVPCSIIYIEWLGFVTIPILSLTAFSLISTVGLMVGFRAKE